MTIQRFTTLLCLALLCSNALAKPKDSAPPVPNPAKAPVPEWIWSSSQPHDNEDAFFRKTFEAPADVRTAVLFATCDDSMVVFLNGKQVTSSNSWQNPTVESVKPLLRPGRNVLAVKGHNDASAAGLLAKLEIVDAQGKSTAVVTDATWKSASVRTEGWQNVSFNDASWKSPHSFGKYGIAPWNDLAGPAGTGQATPAEQLTTLPGFKVELLYSVPKIQDSWVSLCVDPKGRIIASGQSGPLFRVTPGKDTDSTEVEKIDIPIGQAQGLLYANDSLYVMVNGNGIGGHGAGFYRMKSNDGGETYQSPELLIRLNNGGEHGPHCIRLGPDKHLYILAGNFTDLPKDLAPTSPLKDYAEDQLTPRAPDGNGFATGRMAPGGWIIRCDADGKNAELFCGGFRNPYSMDFNPQGELFTWDADMEWDIGSPWYRPTRVCMGNSGGEYGWRYGTGKWPEYFEDSLPPVVNTGLGSPTGVMFGTGAKFPAAFQNALFGCDWAYGKIDVFDLQPDGSGYKASFRPFVSGKAFDPTDLVINPKDGAMYFAIGGRGTQSGLYRVTYVGSESTAPAQPSNDGDSAAARQARHRLERFHGRRDPQAVAEAWDALNSTDRYLRFAARVAVEWQPVAEWQQKALDEKRPTASIEAMIALSRLGDKSLQPQVLASLDRLQLSSLTPEQLLGSLRAYGLCFIRLGHPDEAETRKLQSKFDALYPSTDRWVNRELCRILTYLDAPTVVPKSMALLAKSSTQEDQLHYAFMLRTVKDHWTPELRRKYFEWVDMAMQNYHGGASFHNFLDHMKQDAEATLSPAEKQQLASVLRATAHAQKVIPPRQFVRNWQMPDLLPDLGEANHGRNFARGKAAFEAVQCTQCHRFKDEGDGSIGPDLTAVGNRFTPEYILESILLPSKVVSDQYANTQVVTKDRDVIVGRVMKDDADKLVIRPSPLSEATVTVDKKDIARRELSKVSPMPEGLVDVLEKDEIYDLIAYLRAGGNPEDPAFKPGNAAAAR